MSDGLRDDRLAFGEAIAALVLATVTIVGCGREDVPGDASSTGAASTSSTAESSGPDASTGLATTGSTTHDDSGSSGGPVPMACNGAQALCGRTFDTVVFPGTHNAFAATEAGFAPVAANQVHAIPTQLADGIRVLLLDVYLDNGEVVLCHGACGFGSTPHLEVLQQIHDFLVANPTEVLTIIYQDDVAPAEIEADFVEVGLVDLTYVHEGGAWPTLGEMIDADTRLVVTAEQGGPPPVWYHHVWDLTWDTPYTFTSIDDFSCDPNRGDPSNPLFLVNHWVSTEANLPDAGRAAEANALDVLLARIEACPRRPTFLAVDFYEQGDLFAAVNALNDL